MSHAQLPGRVSLEYLKKLAKDRLRDLRHANPHTQLASALLSVAREYGFASWRALKAEVEERRAIALNRFFDACGKGDMEALGGLLAADPGLARVDNPDRPHSGWTGLHTAAHRGHLDAVRLLLAHGADLNAREAGDNTYALHWAAAAGYTEVVRTLLDAGGDVHGIGDLHELDAIGWATVFWPAERAAAGNRDVVSLLLERGARHHIFSAIATGDLALIQGLVEENPEALDRRMSRFEQGQTSLHFAISRKRYDILELLIGLGADLEAEDRTGQTAFAAAMLRGDREAQRILHAAGAKPPQRIAAPDLKTEMAKLANTVGEGIPMINVPDIARTLDWYASIGFKEIGRYQDDGIVNFGMIAFGEAKVGLGIGKSAPDSISLWFYTSQVDRLYALLKSRQIDAAHAALAGEPEHQEGIAFEEDIYDPFYGGRQFSIRDLNGYTLCFYQPGKN